MDLTHNNLTNLNLVKVHVLGLGVQQQALLGANAQAALLEADCVMGSARQLDTVAHYTADAVTALLPSLKDLPQTLQQLSDDGVQQLVILASGDPLYYGIGAWLRRQLEANLLQFHPAVSSVQAACHLLGLSLQDVSVLSIHGRPLAILRTQLQANRTLVLLTDKHSHPQAIAQECVAAGLDESYLHVCEDLGYPQQKVRRFRAQELANASLDFSPLNVVVIETSKQTSFFPSAPGIEDDKFVTDKGEGKGMITKRDMRVAILSYLDLAPQDLVWDIGAGCGGVSVELSYWQPEAKIVALEHNAARFACLTANRERFGVLANLTLIEARAPEALASLPDPTKVFIGGSDGDLALILNLAWQRLPLNGVLVATAVTENTKSALLLFADQRAAEQDGQMTSVQYAISKAESLAGQHLYRPNLPVTLFHFIKIT